MYIPKTYRELDQDTIEQFIRSNDFAMFISFDGERPVASHLLLEFQHGEGDTLYINGHMARANEQWRTFNPEQEVLAIFSGPHTYISPRWYDHVNVPTWDYLSIHVYGKPRLITDHAELHAMLSRLVDKYEANSGAKPSYHLETLPEDFVERQMNAIVGFQMQVTRIDTSFKLSQNRNERDYDNIIKELYKRTDDNSLGVAQAMQKKRSKLFGGG
ncbi:MAG: FMN-binding negative transcriptional regulator [Anaerolineales bacterium]